MAKGDKRAARQPGRRIYHAALETLRAEVLRTTPTFVLPQAVREESAFNDAVLNELVKRSEQTNGSWLDRQQLGRAIAKRLETGRELTVPARAYLARALRANEAAEAFGNVRRRGRNREFENMRLHACAQLVCYFEKKEPRSAYKRAAAILGYATAKSLRDACGSRVARWRAWVAAGSAAETRAEYLAILGCTFHLLTK